MVIEMPYDRHELDRAIGYVLPAAASETPRRRSGGRAQVTASSADTGAEAPLLDAHVLNRLLTDLGVERCGRIVDSFVPNAPRLSQALSRGMAANDLAAVAETAHRLISATSVVGLGAVATRARELYRCCTARDTRAARTQNAELQTLTREATAALAAHWAQSIEAYGAGACTDPDDAAARVAAPGGATTFGFMELPRRPIADPRRSDDPGTSGRRGAGAGRTAC